MSGPLQGLISPILTPFNDDFSVAEDLFLAHADWSLRQGVHMLSPFGTTGEAVHVGIAERMGLLERLVAHGIPAARLLPGTGQNALPDTVRLTRHAVDLGCAGAMVLPPFYYPHSEDGLFRHYAMLIEAVGSDRLRLCLYHIPQMTGVAIPPALVRRLADAFPGIVAAYKDSSGDWENARAVIEAAPDVAVFPATENQLRQGLAHGAAGSISATLNSQPAAVRRYYDALKSGDADRAAELEPSIRAHRDAVQAAGFIPALKSMIAQATGEARWRNIRPPSDPAPEGLGARLAQDLGWRYAG